MRLLKIDCSKVDGGYMHEVWEVATVNSAKLKTCISHQKISMIMPEEFHENYKKDPTGFMKKMMEEE